jgi:hypothetical protein
MYLRECAPHRLMPPNQRIGFVAISNSGWASKIASEERTGAVIGGLAGAGTQCGTQKSEGHSICRRPRFGNLRCVRSLEELPRQDLNL